MEILLGFPLNLVWGALLIWGYRPGWSQNILLAGSVVVLSIGLFLPDQYFLSFWLPHGMSTLVVTLAFTLPFYYPKGSLEQVLSVRLPSRAQLREAMVQAPFPEDRQSLYLKIVKDYSLLWSHKDKILTVWNTQVLIWLMVVCTVLGFGVLAQDFFTGETVANYLQQANELSRSMLPKEVIADELAEANKIALSLSPAMYFVMSSIFVLFYLSLARLVVLRKVGMAVPVGQLVLFRLPDVFIWGVIAIGAMLLAVVLGELNQSVFIITLNLMIILVFLYFLNGLSIVQLFFEIRLLPGSWILLGIFMASLFWAPLFLVLVAAVMILGLGDFFFNFRKKALQPAILSENG